MGSFVRKVKTASGATAVQIVHKRGKQRLGIDHIGSAHDQAELELLLQVARERLAEGQDELDRGWELAGRPPGQAVVQSTASTVLWEALVSVYDSLGFDALGDECFRQLVLARVVEPTSKADSIRVLEGLGITPASLRTITRTLPRINERDYRGQLAHACWAHVTVRGGVALVMYDVTTLYFEAENEDGLRKVGMSEERRVDPQITVGLLVDPSGYPLDVHVFEGSKAETKTLLPVIEAFQTQGRVEEDRPGSAPTAQGHTPRPAACRVCLMLQARMGADPYAAEHGDHREAYAEGSAVIARTYVASAGQLTAAA